MYITKLQYISPFVKFIKENISPPVFFPLVHASDGGQTYKVPQIMKILINCVFIHKSHTAFIW